MINSVWEEFNEAVLFEDNNDAGDDDLDLDTGDDASTDTQSDDSGIKDTSADDDTNSDNTTDDQSDDQTDDTPEQDDNGDGQEDDILDDTGDGSEDGGEGDSSTDDGTSEEMDPGIEDDSSNDPNAKLKELEKSIFDQLSTEQKALKTKELKTLYNSVYDKCAEIINTISAADRNPEQAKVYDYVMNSLTDLQKYIKDYLFNIYDSKTYIENMVQLQKYLTVLDTVSNIFEEVKNSSDQENKDN